MEKVDQGFNAQQNGIKLKIIFNESMKIRKNVVNANIKTYFVEIRHLWKDKIKWKEKVVVHATEKLIDGFMSFKELIVYWKNHGVENHEDV